MLGADSGYVQRYSLPYQLRLLDSEILVRRKSKVPTVVVVVVSDELLMAETSYCGRRTNAPNSIAQDICVCKADISISYLLRLALFFGPSISATSFLLSFNIPL